MGYSVELIVEGEIEVSGELGSVVKGFEFVTVDFETSESGSNKDIAHELLIKGL